MADEKKDLLKCMWYGIFFEHLTTGIKEDSVRILDYIPPSSAQAYEDYTYHAGSAEMWRRVKANAENLEAVIDDVHRCGIEPASARQKFISLQDAIKQENVGNVILAAVRLGDTIIDQARNIHFE